MCGNKKRRPKGGFFLKRERGVNERWVHGNIYIVHIIGVYRPAGKRESAPFLKILPPQNHSKLNKSRLGGHSLILFI